MPRMAVSEPRTGGRIYSNGSVHTHQNRLASIEIDRYENGRYESSGVAMFAINQS